MRIYEGSPRQDFEDVFRSIGAFLDSRGTRDILLLEVPDGFIVQGLVTSGQSGSGTWSESIGTLEKETLTFLDDDIARFMEEALSRRGVGRPNASAPGSYEQSLRVIGRWMDGQKPKDVFLFEQEGAYVVRLLVGGQAGVHHLLAEFTRDDVSELVAQGPTLRVPERAKTAAPGAAPAASQTPAAPPPAPRPAAPAPAAGTDGWPGDS
jgi:hypothetical protein